MVPPKHIVIVGAGIIGSTTALYLVRHPQAGITPTSVAVTVIEASAHGAAQGASGKAGGLIAKWAYPKELTEISFEEHVRLAGEYGGAERWGWRWTSVGEWRGHGHGRPGHAGAARNSTVRADAGRAPAGGDDGSSSGLGKRDALPPVRTTISDSPLAKTAVAAAASASASSNADADAMPTRGRLPSDLDWVSEELTDAYEPLAQAGETAQVHPYLFTRSMLELSMERGVRVQYGCRVTALDVISGRVRGVRYVRTGPEDIEKDNAGEESGAAGAGRADDGEYMAADCVILAAGAWSSRLLPALPISGTRAHSIVIRAPSPESLALGTNISPYVLFT
jgi:glycine/D-amino acid oxidase-like deaminating enzyme